MLEPIDNPFGPKLIRPERTGGQLLFVRPRKMERVSIAMSHPAIRYVAIGLAALAFAVPGAAQTMARGEVSGGYQFLRVEGESVSKGWSVDLSWYGNRRLAVVGQVSASYKPRTTFPVFGRPFTESETVYNFLVGVRMRNQGNRVVVPFGHVLVGNGLTIYASSPKMWSIGFHGPGSSGGGGNPSPQTML